MKLHRLRLIALSSGPLFAIACAGEAEPRGLELAVAPLELEGIGQACYDIRVTNQTNRSGQTVWAKGTPGHQLPLSGTDKFKTGDPDAVCSGQYGNARGGDITYIGACDADGQANVTTPRVGTGWTPENPTDGEGERVNSVTLWFDGLYDVNGNYIVPTGEDGWQDPCPNGCTLDVLCEENADNLVEFNFTVMRDAQQGFFDIAVNFEDIFCSAKFDSCGGGTPVPGDVPPRVLKGATVAQGWTRDLVLYPYETKGEQGKPATNRTYVFDLETNEQNQPTQGGASRGWFAASAAKFDDGSITAADIAFVGKANEVKPPRDITYGAATITAVQRPLSTTQNTLLFGPDGERDHTAVAALACTAGPDSSASGTTLVFDVPTIKCLDTLGKKVWFKLAELDDQDPPDGQGRGGNGVVASDVVVADDYTTGSFSLRYGLYYDKEDLTCPPQAATDGRFYYTGVDGKKTHYAKRSGQTWTLYEAGTNRVVRTDIAGATPPATITVNATLTVALASSCNKVFYNIGFNIAHLAEQGLQGCVFEWSGTALETDEVDTLINASGAFTDPNGIYPGVEYKGIVLTGRASQGKVPTVCSENPLNGDWSNVRTGYLKGLAFGPGGGYETDYASDGVITEAFDD